MNFLTACVAFLGAALVLAAARSIPSLETLLLPVAAGNFLYIAGSDLIPELHKEARLPHAIVQLAAILAGIGVMQILSFLG
jgi:zinc and cadmium transporter